jgi:putative NIF3 family GTP cyclohydrolase 1 type 2
MGTFKGNDSSHPSIGKPGKKEEVEEIKMELIFNSFNQNKILKALISSHPYEEVAYDIYNLENVNSTIGAGLIGELETEIDELSFLKSTKNVMQTNCIRHTKFSNRKIKKVAVCGGSGSFLLKAAMQQGADVLVTADFKYHEFFDADNKILIADIGHYESEQFTIDLLYEYLLKKNDTFALLKTKFNTNPVNYL